MNFFIKIEQIVKFIFCTFFIKDCNKSSRLNNKESQFQFQFKFFFTIQSFTRLFAC